MADIIAKMKSFLKGLSRKRLISIIALFIVTITVFIVIWAFTSQDNAVSNARSGEIAKRIENLVARHFPVDHTDLFWRKTLNHILRKAAHFLEYMLLGMTVCAFLNVLLFNLGKAAVISAVFCPFIAIIDEFRQNFVSGRNPQIGDVMIDTFGALFGVVLVSAVSAFIWMVRKQKKRIRFLESVDGSSSQRK